MSSHQYTPMLTCLQTSQPSLVMEGSQSASKTIPSVLQPLIPVNKRKALSEFEDIASRKLKFSRISDFPTVLDSHTFSKRKAQKTNTKSSTKSFPPNSLLNTTESFWIHYHPENKHLRTRFTRTPDVLTRVGMTTAYNVFWVTPKSTAHTDKINESDLENFVQGGKNQDSFYVRQLNRPSSDSIAMLLAHGTEIHIALVTGLQQIFPSFSAAQINKIYPSKEQVEKLSPETVRGIAHCIATSSGFPKGVSTCRCVPLQTWDKMMMSMFRKVTSLKKKVNPATPILALISNFENEYAAQESVYGLEENHDTEMYDDELQALIRGLAQYYLEFKAKAFMAMLKSVKKKRNFIKVKSATLAGQLKIAGWQPTPSESFTAAVDAADVQRVQLQIENLQSRVADNARIIINCRPDKPEVQSAKQMLKSSAYMKYCGEENEIQLEDMVSALNSKAGGKNPMMVGILGQRAQAIWIGALTVVLHAWAAKIDCSGIRAEHNKTGSGNKCSGYDSGSHLGSVSLACTQGGNEQQKDTFSCRFEAVCKFAGPSIKKAWLVVEAELVELVSGVFPNESGIQAAFKDLQMQVGMSSRMAKLTQVKNRRLAVTDLKWIFLLYCEMLPVGQIPTTQNFIQVMVSKLGVSLCNVYLAWVSTGLYRLKIKAHKGHKLPAHIKLQDDAKTTTINNSLTGVAAEDLFDVLECLVGTEWSPDQTILFSAQENARNHNLSECHTNIALGRAAAASMYWLLGCIRTTEQFAMRPGVLEQMHFRTSEQWKAIQPKNVSGAELRLGLNFILHPFGDIEYCHAHKTVGDGSVADPLFESKAARGWIRKSGQWKSDSQAHKDGSFDSTKLSTVFARFKEAAEIRGGNPAGRQFLINVKDPLTGQYVVSTSSVVSSPVMPLYSKYHHFLNEKLSSASPQKFDEMMSPLLKINPQSIGGKLATLASQGITPCYRPPRGCFIDHTLAKGKNHSKTGKFIEELFKDVIAPAIVNGTQLEMNKRWDMKTVKPPLIGLAPGKIVASSVYNFKETNTATMANLSRFEGMTAEKLASTKLVCAKIMTGELKVHPNYFGRQTQLSQLVAVLQVLRQLPDWTNGEAGDRRLAAAIKKMSANQLHELAEIIEKHYLDVHKTSLGNPVSLFSRFDDRIRAHPTQPIFSLAGIEQWPCTIVEPSTVDSFSSSSSSSSTSSSALERALDNVQLLTVQEQIFNLATLTAYRDSLQWIIDNQDWLREKDSLVLVWFEKRANYDAMEVEQPIRHSPRGKKRRKR